MTPYVTGKPIEEVKRELGLTRVIKLASNENPLGPAPNIFVGNGSDELIHLLSLLLLAPGDEMLMGEPGFARYPAGAHLVEATVTRIPMNSEMRHDLPAFARAATERTKLIFIANPNNPTGTIVRKAEVDRLLADIPDTTVVVLDEAYADFTVGVNDFPDSIPYVLEGRNVVGLRT